MSQQTPHLTRGERNLNPGNIDRTDTVWQGMRPVQDDPRFCQFETPVAGIRALAKTLLTYQEAHGLKTIQAIIDRWAPPTENMTSAYVQDVCKRMQAQPDTPVNLHLPNTLQTMVLAIICHENGRCLYSASTLHAGIMAALA